MKETCLLKVSREVTEWMVSGRLFHTHAAATPNAHSLTVRSRVHGTISLPIEHVCVWEYLQVGAAVVLLRQYQ